MKVMMGHFEEGARHRIIRAGGIAYSSCVGISSSMQKPMRLTDLIPAIVMGMPYINTVILDSLKALDPNAGIRMRNPASANDSVQDMLTWEQVRWRSPRYLASANDLESVLYVKRCSCRCMFWPMLNLFLILRVSLYSI